VTLDLRRLGPGDAEAFASEMARAVAAGDMLASSDPVGAFVLKIFGVDPGQFAGAFDAGELVGFISPDFKIAVVRPDRRRQGIGRALVDVGLAMEREKGHRELLLGVVPGEPIGPMFLAATGFAFHSTVWDLDLPPDRAVPPPSWPAGHIGRLFDRSGDVERWVALFNAAFADHPTPLQLDPKLIAGALDDPDQDDGDTVLVEEVATGELVGFCACDVGRHDGVVSGHGELWSIGVRPDRQGRGLGRQLVRAGVQRAREIGVRELSLSVNGRNEGALGLYESEGFVRRRTRDRWARPVPVEGQVAGTRL
jgi:mycothiol synthase